MIELKEGEDMNFETLKYEQQDHIGILTLNRPEALNALNDRLIGELDQAMDRVCHDETVKVLIITGGEKVFAAGGDIKVMLKCDPQMAREYVKPIHKVFRKIEELPKPTIAAINGFVLGGGVELTLVCDFRVAADNAKFGFPEINLGIFPAAGGSQRLPRLIGMSRAKELMFTGDAIDAGRAFQIGLVNQVVPSGEVMDAALKLAAKLSKKSPLTMATLKSSLHSILNSGQNTGLEMELEKFCFLFASHDQKEGMQAFLDKRKPEFTGK